jgi:hypothetical protein
MAANHSFMARGEKLLERMRGNPRDWRIDDVKTLCGAFALDLDAPPGGSHYGVSDPTQRHHVTIPFRRPIKPVYIRQLVRFVDTVLAARREG